jgi:hypothetical protein
MELTKRSDPNASLPSGHSCHFLCESDSRYHHLVSSIVESGRIGQQLSPYTPSLSASPFICRIYCFLDLRGARSEDSARRSQNLVAVAISCAAMDLSDVPPFLRKWKCSLVQNGGAVRLSDGVWGLGAVSLSATRSMRLTSHERDS